MGRVSSGSVSGRRAHSLFALGVKHHPCQFLSIEGRRGIGREFIVHGEHDAVIKVVPGSPFSSPSMIITCLRWGLSRVSVPPNAGVARLYSSFRGDPEVSA